MVNKVRNLRVFLIGGTCAFAVTACAQSYQTTGDASLYGGYGASQSGYGYAQDGYGYAQSGYDYDYAQTNIANYSSRYGDLGSTTGLRGSCGVVGNSCGMMAVVPVYPVYQYVTNQPETVAEAPVVDLPYTVELDPIPYVEPEPIPYVEPVYEAPAMSWPEPEEPVMDWKPLRK